jgi:hypothetical protein
VNAEPTTSADAANLTPPYASRASFVRPDVRSPIAALASAIAVDANTCIELLQDAVGDASTPRDACLLFALVALVQRMGWTADELSRATSGAGGLDDDIGWFTTGTYTDAARALRAIVPGGAR